MSFANAPATCSTSVGTFAFQPNRPSTVAFCCTAPHLVARRREMPSPSASSGSASASMSAAGTASRSPSPITAGAVRYERSASLRNSLPSGA